ncbi:MAG: inorganic phosphate transporter [Clostridiaceae bacterium]|nr:inorganic phosphate transporter [Clostridiaceae bacterium]
MVALYFVLLLVCASVFVNGWTDAPNAIATVVSTRVLSPKAAIILATIFNLAGVFMMGTAVANTTANIISIGTGRDALVTLAAAQLSIVVWAVSAWRFGIPTSESHALIAGLMGAGISFKGIEAFNWEEFKKVLIGLGVATVLGFIAGYFFTKLIVILFRRANRRKSNAFFSWGQVASAASMAFNHGAQDGQKFMGVFALALTVGGIFPYSDSLVIPAWVKLLVALLMAVGTSIGGYRIIKTMGMDMVRLEKYQGFAAEVGASACMTGATLLGIPLSTTNAKGTAMMGAGAARRFSDVNWGIVKEMLIAWALTFPACLLLGYGMAKLFNFIF